MGVMDRYNKKKKQEEEESKGTSSSLGGVQSRYEVNKTLGPSNHEVNESFINTFISDVNNFLGSAEEEIGTVGWGNASTIYNKRNEAWKDLYSRSNSISRWLDENKGNIKEDAYKNLSSNLDSFRTNSSSVLDSFKSAVDYYSQWETEDEYNSWYEAAKKKAEDEQKITGASDYKEYSQKGASIENPSMKDAEGAITIFGNRIGGEDIGNIVTYSRDNEFELRMGAVNGSRLLGDFRYAHMTDTEVGIYNYYLAKFGEDKASEYLKSIDDELDQREAGALAKNFDDNAFLEALVGFTAGVESSVQGLKGLADFFTGKESGTDYSANQYMDQMIASNNEGILKGVHDVSQAIGGMTPSILVSSITGVPLLGTAMMGASAVGNGYNQMIDLGYNEWQARGYGMLVGVSETALQYALGGISKLGGKVTGKAVTNLVSKFDNAIARTAIKLGGNMASEGLEEAIQTVLEPAFKALIAGEEFEAPKWGDIWHSALIGALTAGVLEGAPTISGEVSTYQQGKALKETGTESVDRLVSLGQTFSADSVAYQLAGKVNEQTGAYTIGRLFNEVGATLSEQNKTDIAKALVEKGMTEKDAATISKWLGKAVDGGYFTKGQIAALESNEVISSVFQDVIINQNSTVNQRIQGYNESLHTLAEEMSRGKAVAEPTEAQQTASEPTAMLSKEEFVRRVAEATGLDATAVAQGFAQQAKDTSVTENTPVEQIATEGKFEASETGKAKIGDTEVTIKEIASIKDGEMILRLEDDSTVNANDVEYGSSAEALIYENVADMNLNAATANAFVKGYDPSEGLSAQEYVLGFREAYRYGEYGFPVQEMSKNGFSAKLSQTQRSLAYDLGKTDMKYKVSAQQEKIASTGAINSEKNASKGAKKGKVHYAEGISTKGMTQRQKASLKGLERLAEALGVEFHIFESEVGENGKRKGANGWFDPKDGSIHIDLHAGLKGEGTILFTASHELTHFIREWSPAKFKVFADFLLEQYGQKGISVDALVRNQIAKAKRNGRDIDFDTAYEEVIADSCESMLADGEIMQKLAELKAKDKTLWEKIKSFITDLVAKIKAAYAGLSPDSIEGRYVAEMLDAATNLKTLFTDALVDAGENYSEIREALGDGSVIEVNENGEFTVGKTKDGDLLFNDRTYDEGGRETLRATLEAEGYSDADIDAALAIIDGKHELVKRFGNVYKQQDIVNKATLTTDLKNGKAVLSAIVSNGDYPVNIDLSMVCKKRVAYQNVINRLCQSGLINQATIDSLAIAEINKVLGKYGFETACLGCFVESRRIRIQEWAQTICKEWNGIVDKMVGKGNAKAFGFAEETFVKDLSNAEVNALSTELDAAYERDGLHYGRTTVVKKMEQLLREVPSLRKHLSVADLITPTGRTHIKSLSSELNSLIACRYGSNTPKIVQDFNPYNHELAQYGKVPKGYDTLREYLYAIGGARMQSFSDFIVENWFDYCQIVADLAARKLPMHTYTKEISLAKLFGMTGIKVNMSLIPDIDRSLGKEYAGLTKNAKGEYELIFADKDRFKATGGKSYMQSINFADAVALQQDPRYSSNVGTIAVGISDNHIRMMLGDSRIRMVIPYHSSGMNPIFAHLVGTDYYKDYTPFQNTGVAYLIDSKGNKKSFSLTKDQKAKITAGFEFNAVLQELGDARAAAQAYLDWCADASKHTITINGQTYTAVLTPKFSEFADHENYYKLLEDFNTYDSITEAAAPQGDVKQIYPEDFDSILEDEIRSRDNYRKKQEPKWDLAMGEIEGYLKTHKKADTIAYAKEHGIKLSKKDMKLSDRDSYAPTFYSYMGKVVDDIKTEKIGAGGVVSYLKGKGVKDEEIKWSGIEAFLDGKKSVTKEELQEFVAGSQLVIEEEMGAGGQSITLEPSRYGDDSWDVMRGGEILDTYSWNEDSELYESDMTGGGFSTKERLLDHLKEKYGSGGTRWGQYKIDGGTNYRELVFKMPNSSYSNDAMKVHWGKDAEGILAHARIQDITTKDGKKMLFIEEIQSDWHNAGQKHGYEGEDTETSRNAKDYKTLQTMIRMLYDGNMMTGLDSTIDEDIAVLNVYAKSLNIYDVIIERTHFGGDPEEPLVYVMWCDGDANVVEENALDFRKELIKTLEEIRTVELRGYGHTEIAPDAPFRTTYHEYALKRLIRMAAEEGYDSIGWTPADVQSERWSDEYAEGYRIEYDQDIPKFLRKYGKKWGATVGKTALPSYEPNATYYDVNRQEEYRSFTEWQNVVEQDLKAQGAPIRNLKYESDDNYWIAFDKVSGTEYDRAEIRKTSGFVWSMDIPSSMKDSVLHEGQVLYSDRDSVGNTLSEGQQEFFKDSKVRDKNGNLLVAYHSTPNDVFYEFDETKHKTTTGTSVWGKGFYFSDEKASYYWSGEVGAKNTLKCYLDIKNPLYTGNGERVPQDLKDYIISTDAYKESSEYRKKYLESGNVSRWYDFLRFTVLNDGDANSVLQHLGYDGIIVGDNYEIVIFNSNQAKLTSNKTPTSDPDIRYSDRDTDSVSNRSLLADALESVAQNDIERAKLKEYKSKIALIESEQAKLAEVKAQIKELSFAKGKRDTEAIKQLQFEANQSANRINTYDRQLLNLEATADLKGVLQREKQMAYKKAEREGKEALAKYREKAANTQRELLTRYQESRKKGVEGRRKTEMRHKIKDVVNELNQYLKNTKEKHVPIGLQKPVAEALAAVNMDTVGAAERIAKLEADLMKAKSPDAIREISRKIDNIREMGERMDVKLQALKDAYDDIVNSTDPVVANSHDEVISNSIARVIKEVGNTPLRDMSLSQLEEVYNMYRMVLTTIRSTNKAFKAAKGEEISTIANGVIAELVDMKRKSPKQSKGMKALSEFDWNNLKPVYAFERIGSANFRKVFNAVRAGEDTWAVDITEAKEFSKEQRKKYNYGSWDFNKKYGFTSKSGDNFELDLGEIMSLYAYAKDEHSKGHLTGDGFVFDPKKEVVVKTKTGIKVTYNLENATSYNLAEETLASIIGKLTQEQKDFVDAMQDYLSTTMGEKGNEVSLALYDIKLFKKKNYFPLKVSHAYMAVAKEKAQGDVKIKNKGFTKERKDGAKNTVVLTSFMDVWADHVNEMSMYHAFTLPLEDFYRVFNYKAPGVGNFAPVSVNGKLIDAHGNASVQYIEQLLKDLNGGARVDPTAGIINKMTGLFKKSAVFASASVVIQQPSAIARATALVDTKYFVGKPTKGKHSELWAEVKKYAPVAVIKEMGYFDTGMGQSTVEWIKDEKTLMDKVDDIASKAPALADEYAWCVIWNAVKRETLHTYKHLAPNSDAFLKAVGERFTEVVTKTQVYDSVLSRSANMRSKDTGMKMATAFMAEPTTSLNMIEDALMQGKRGNKRYARKAIGAVAASMILNSILVSFVYAGRDDDEDKTYTEKYIGTLTEELLDSFNPLTLIPFVKDIVSIVQGYDVERSDMAVVTDIIKAWKNLGSDNRTVYRKVEDFAGAIASVFGLPVKNIMRDARAMYNTVNSLVNGEKTTGMGIKNALAEAVTGKAKTDGQQLYEAMLKGDTAQIERVKGRFKDDKAITSAIRTALRENDSRIHDAAVARYNGNIAEYTRIAREIISEGNFKQDDVVAAINAEINALKKGEGTTASTADSNKATSIFKMEDYYTALVGRDQASAQVVKEDIIKTAMANGKDRDEAEADFNSSFASHLRDEYEAGMVTDYEAVNMLVNYGGRTEEGAEAKVQYWAFKQKYPDFDLSEEAVTKYYSDVEPSGIDIEVYYDYSKQRSKCKGVDLNGDGKTDSGSVKREVLDVINSLPITYHQKDVLYYLNGWSASTIWEAPWH